MKTNKKSGTDRSKKIAEQIRQDISIFIQRELQDSKMGMVTISEVQLTPDYAHAKLYFSVFAGDSVHALKVLNDKAGLIRSHLFKLLHIHTVPSLKFIYDDTVEKAMEMSKLIEIANQSRAIDDESREEDAP